MPRIPSALKTRFSGFNPGKDIASLPLFLYPSFNLLREERPGRFEPFTVSFLSSGEVRLAPGFDFGLDLSVRAAPDTWEEILSGRTTLLSEFLRGRARLRNQRTAWTRFLILSFLLSKR